MASPDLQSKEAGQICLVDFSISEYIVDAKGNQRPAYSDSNFFQGSLSFLSRNIFYGFNMDKRDDLIQLAYTLVFLASRTLPWTKSQYKGASQEEKLAYIAQLKQQCEPRHICNANSAFLLDFLTQVYAINYGETPNYAKLKFSLVKALLNMNQTPDNHFEWQLRKPDPVPEEVKDAFEEPEPEEMDEFHYAGEIPVHKMGENLGVYYHNSSIMINTKVKLRQPKSADVCA